AFLQRMADVLAVMVAFAVGYWLYHLDGTRYVGYGLSQFLALSLISATVVVVVFQSLRLYEGKVSLLNVVETRLLLIGWFLSSLLLFSLTFYLRYLDLSRLMVSISL